MRGRREERVEAAVDHLAAAVLGGAVGFTLFELVGQRLSFLELAGAATAAAATAYLVTARMLRRIEPQRPSFDFPVFRMADLDLAEPDELLLTEQVELVLTEADRVPVEQSAESQELLLDDILAELGPDSRVVRLFDPYATPTPGQLRSRIDRYLAVDAPESPPADASKALYDALTELRRSLR